MKRPSSVERETPKKRRKSRVPRTSSPLFRQHSVVPLSVQEARASSELFHEALEKNKAKFVRESSAATNATLAPALSLLETPPASSPPEMLETVVQKLPSCSDFPDMGVDDKDTIEEKLPDAVQKTQGESDLDKAMADHEAVKQVIKAAAEETGGGKNTKKEVIDLQINAEKSLVPKSEPDGPKKNDDIEIVQPLRQGSGSSADDAMVLDTSPSEQLEQEHQLSQQNDSSQQDAEKPASLVSSKWVLEKLEALRADTLDADRAAVVQQMHDMEHETAQLPRADMHPVSVDSPSRRLGMVETLIARELAAVPAEAWRTYKGKLLRWCRGTSIHGMDYRQRLEKVREILYVPEEMEMVRRGDEKRIECVIRMCAAVTEITGPDDEIVPEEMNQWVAVQIKDLAWKVKVTSVWRKYWPEENGKATGN
ncbi:hypothetical protein PWT90_07296 [Aphanocladium album]|nr:hypothetical protein PWT90_07296 [Aphanocladium album]